MTGSLKDFMKVLSSLRPPCARIGRDSAVNGFDMEPKPGTGKGSGCERGKACMGSAKTFIMTAVSPRELRLA